MNEKFDVFLCHNSEDKPIVKEIRERLIKEKIRPWLDIVDLRPGTYWQIELDKIIRQVSSAAVFFGKNGVGPWQEPEILSLKNQLVRRNCPVIPVILPGWPDNIVIPGFLENLHWVNFKENDPDPFKQLIWGITGEKYVIIQSQDLSMKEISDDNPQDIENELSKGRFPTVFPQEKEYSNQEEVLNPKAIDSYIRPYKYRKNRIKNPEFEIYNLMINTFNGDDLKSERGIDYRSLQNYLQNRMWREADLETHELISQAAFKDSHRLFFKEDLQKIPCTDLLTIDNLWSKYSAGWFCFTVQYKIWINFGKPTHIGEKWSAFCREIGWQSSNDNRYLSYMELKMDPGTSPRGEIPSGLYFFRSLFGGFLVKKTESEVDGSIFFSHIDKCKNRLLY